MWNYLYFIRNDKEYREVIINKDTYYIKGITSAFGGKYHNNPNLYIKKMLRNGWRKCSNYEYMIVKYGRNLSDFSHILSILHKKKGITT